MSDAPALDGIHHVKLPVSDIARSRDWYTRVVGLEVDMEFRDEGEGPVRGIDGRVPGLDDTGLALREAPDIAAALAGFDPIALGVANRSAVDDWVAHLDRLGIEHSPVIRAAIGWLVTLRDPDGIELRLYSRRLD